MPTLKEIPLRELCPGMFVECYGDGSLANPHVRFADFIHDQEGIEALAAQGVPAITIDLDRSKTPTPNGGAEAVGHEAIPAKPPGMEASRRLYGACLSHVTDMMTKVREGLDVDVKESFKAVDALLEGLERDSRNMVLLAKLHHYDDYTFRHSLNVSVLALIFGKHLGMAGDELKRLGFAGLYHDVGKFLVPIEILNKPARLSEREFTQMKGHSLLGYQLLSQQGGISEDILLGVLHHHERYDGMGYPRQLKAEEKDRFARVLSIVDVFDALSSDRIYRKATTPHETIKAMFAWRNETFHPGLLEQFVRCFGVYPAGSFVRLTDQTCGVVLEARPDSPSRPLVKVSFTKKLMPQLPVLLDLSQLPPAAEGGLDIEECLDPKLLGVDVERFV